MANCKNVQVGLAALALSCFAVCAGADVREEGAVWTVETPRLEVRFDARTGATSVLDKTANYTWLDSPEREAVVRPRVPIRKLAAQFEADGDLKEWTGVSPIKITSEMVGDAGRPDNDADCSALVYVGWQEDALCLALDVTDDKLAFTKQGFPMWESDSVEVWMGLDHIGFTKGSMYCWTDKRKAGACKTALRVRPNGYALEALLPLGAFFSGTPRGFPGAAFPFAVGVNDADDTGDREGQIYFPESWVHSQPETFVDAVLADEKGAAPEAVRMIGQVSRWEVQGVEKLPGPALGIRVRYTYRPQYDGDAVPVTVEMALDQEAPDLRYTIRCAPDAEPGQFAFPRGFLLPSADGYVMVPHRQGFLYASYEKNPRYAHEPTRLWGWSTMRWFGAVDLKQGHGYAAIFEMPDDGYTDLRRETVGGMECLTATPTWRPQKGKFSYDRRVTYYFSPRGGYVPLCKRFRQHAIEHDMFLSLEEKIERQPMVRTYMNAAFIDACGIGFPQMVKTGRLLRGFGYPAMFTNDWRGAYPRNGKFIRKFAALNVHPGMWKCFKDNIPKDEYDYSTLRMRSDGKIAVGWVCGEKKDGAIMSATCHAAITPYADAYMQHFRRDYIWDLLFHDTTTACLLMECYHPDHPTTRSEDKANKIEFLKYLNTFDAVLASECGRDWAVPYLHSIHGPNQISRPPKVLFPMFGLVFHDAIISHYRWTWTFHHGDFEQKRMYCLLYGNPPSFRRGNEVTQEEREEIFRRSLVVSRFFEQVGTREMLSHEFLNDDLTLQRARFEGGGVACVNFGAENREVEVAGRSYVIPREGFVVATDEMLGYRALVEGKVCEYMASPGCVYVDCPVAHDFGPVVSAEGGSCFTAVALGPRRLLVTPHKPGLVSLRPGKLAPDWDLATTRAFLLNENDERDGEVEVQRRADAIELKFAELPATCEVACGELARAPDFAVVPASVTFSDATPAGGEKITVTAQVANKGDREGRCEVGFYGDLIDGDHRFGVEALSLAPGKTASVNGTLDTAGLSGRHNIWAIAEARPAAGEANILNNDACKYINVGRHYHAKYLVKGFDFGKRGTEEGFIGAFNEAYWKERGWGWSGKTPLGELSSFAGREIEEDGALLGDTISCERRPGVLLPIEERPPGYGATEYTFAADIPNGNYRLGLLLVNGVRGWQTEKLLADIYVEGKLIARSKDIEHRKGHFVLEALVEVGDGKLEVTFKGNWWQLCGLTLQKE